MRFAYIIAPVALALGVQASTGQTPAARLGAPSHHAPTVVPASVVQPASSPVIRAAGPDGPEPSARLGEIGVGPTVRGDDDPYNWGVPASRRRELERNRDRDEWPRRPAYLDRDTDRESSSRSGARLREPAPGRTTGFGKGGDRFDERMGDWWDDRRRDMSEGILGFTRSDRDRIAFESDCEFDGFISPVTNPFLAEDPRALTELRPIFFYQTIPGQQYLYQGGNAIFFGLQGRLALTERFSIVLHKLGGMSLNPGSNSVLESNTGLTEIHVGPKFAFWRNPEDQSLGSFGIIFQMPTGAASIYQDTGKLSLVPYLSYGQRLARTPVGTFNFMNIAGYSLGTNNQRSDFVYDTFQLAWDVGDQRWFYPFVELSWFLYTSKGNERPGLTFEGRDLANVGAPVSGRSYLTIAPGVRFKARESLQFGIATEFPLFGTRDLFQFRLGVDMIWRY